MPEETKNEHEFVHANKRGMSGGEYMVVYCKKCGQIALDQAKSDFPYEVKECAPPTNLKTK